MYHITRKWMTLLLLAALTGVLTSAHAVEPVIDTKHRVVLELVRLSLDNVNDAAGRWQHAGGEVYDDGDLVGHYATHRRITSSGTSPQNTAMLTTTIFFLGENPPRNMTLQGAHDFNSGKSIGSVSAASKPYKAWIGAAFKGDASTDKLVLTR